MICEKKKSSWLILVVTIILLINTISLMAAAGDWPSAPERFYGNVYINEQPAPNGTLVSAWINNTQKISQATINGTYGYVPPASEEFNVDGSPGDAIVFKIYNAEVGNDTLSSGDITQKNLYLNDTESPSTVTGLSVTDAKDEKLDLAWSAATDTLTIVSHYRIYRDTIFLINETSLSYRDTTGLTNGQSYSYQVSAVDIAGNEGTKSDSASGTPTATSEEPGSDPGEETPPVDNPPVISDVSHQPATITSIDTVAITAVVTDDNSVASVTLYWDDGTSYPKAMTLQTGNIYSTTIGPFSEGTTVTYSIKAIDNADHETTSTSDAYSFTTILADETGPTISIISPLGDSVINDTTPIIQANYYDPAGINISSIKILVDNKDITLNAIVSSTAVTYTPTVSLFSGIHTIYVEATDNVSNKATKTWSFTIENPTTLTVTAAGNITVGETKNISLKEYGTILEEMEFTAANNLTDVKINIEMLAEKPVGVTVPSGKLYIYLNIESNVGASDIANLTIKFKVEKTWIQNNSIDKSTVKLVRYHNNTWEELSTQITSEDETYVYYAAQTTGLSTFAVTGVEVLPVSTNWILIIAAIVIIILMVLVIYFIILPKYRKE